MILIPQRGSKDCIQTKYGKKSSSECEGVQIISWGLFWGCRQLPIPLSDIKFEPLCSLKKIVFKYCVCVVSFDHFCGWEEYGFAVRDSGQSFPKDSIFACKTKSV